MKTPSLLILLLSMLLFLDSCQTTGPVSPSEDEFVFRVIVKDSNGNSLPDIRVSAWNLVRIPNGNIIGKKNASSFQTASTCIEVSLQENSNIALNVYDLSDNFISNIADTFLVKGKYAWTWGISDPSPLKIYKCKLTAMDSLFNRTLFSDSIYMTLYQPDWNFTFIGFTDSNGMYETTDQYLFPSTLNNFIPLKYCEWDPIIYNEDTLGTFRFIDSVRVVLTDTSTDFQYIYTEYIMGGDNIYEFTCDLFNTSMAERENSGKNFNKQLFLQKNDTLGDYYWKLYQNYPNPFN